MNDCSRFFLDFFEFLENFRNRLADLQSRQTMHV